MYRPTCKQIDRQTDRQALMYIMYMWGMLRLAPIMYYMQSLLVLTNRFTETILYTY